MTERTEAVSHNADGSLDTFLTKNMFYLNIPTTIHQYLLTLLCRDCFIQMGIPYISIGAIQKTHYNITTLTGKQNRFWYSAPEYRSK